MDAISTMKRKTFGMEGRFSVTVECADDLTADERLMIEAWFETEVGLLQKRERGHSDEEALRWECEALGIDPATQRPVNHA